MTTPDPAIVAAIYNLDITTASTAFDGPCHADLLPNWANP